MDDTIRNEVDRLVEKIVKNIPVNKIILFGSYAYGKPNLDSDIDLCIISADKRRNIDLIHEIRKTIRGAKFPIDILVYKPDEFEYRADSLTSMESNIFRNGVVLYG